MSLHPKRAKSTDFILTLHARDEGHPDTSDQMYDPDPAKKTAWQRVYSWNLLKKLRRSDNESEDRYQRWKTLFTSPPQQNHPTHPDSTRNMPKRPMMPKGFSMDFKDYVPLHVRQRSSKSQTYQAQKGGEQRDASAPSSPITRAKKKIEAMVSKLTRSPAVPRFKNENRVNAVVTKPTKPSESTPSTISLTPASSKSPHSNDISPKKNGLSLATNSPTVVAKNPDSHIGMISFPRPSGYQGNRSSSMIPEHLQMLPSSPRSPRGSSGNHRADRSFAKPSSPATSSPRFHHKFISAASSDTRIQTDGTLFSTGSYLSRNGGLSPIAQSSKTITAMSEMTSTLPQFTASPVESQDSKDLNFKSKKLGTGSEGSPMRHEDSFTTDQTKFRRRRNRKTRGMSAFFDVAARPSEEAIVQKIEEFFPKIEDFHVIEVPVPTNVSSVHAENTNVDPAQRESVLEALPTATTFETLTFHRKKQNENRSNRSTLLLLTKPEVEAAAPIISQSGSDVLLNLKDVARSGIVASNQNRPTRHVSLPPTSLLDGSNDDTISKGQERPTIVPPLSSNIPMGDTATLNGQEYIPPSNPMERKRSAADILDEQNEFIKKYYEHDSSRGTSILLPRSRPISTYSVSSSHSSVIKTTATGATGDGSRQIIWYKGDLIGQGAFGSVFLGLDMENWRLMAVKQVLNFNGGSMQRGGKKFSGGPRKNTLKGTIIALRQEMTLLKSIKHPHIVEYLGFERTENETNVFLEYVPGGSIATVLRKTGPFPEPLVLVLSLQILSGIEYLHSRSIIHRDIKGANILLDNNGIVKISDFGISIQIDDMYKGITDPTVKGTVNWMAPEMVKAQGYGAKVDIWSFGCVLVEMLTGQKPWNNLTLELQIFSQLLKGSIPSIPSSTSMEMTEFMKLALQSDPAKRASATSLFKHSILSDVNAYNYPYREFVDLASENWKRHLIESMKGLDSDESGDSSRSSDASEY